MTLEDLTARKAAIKAQIDTLHEQARALSSEQAALIEQEHLDRARESMQAWADANSLTLDEAIAHWQGRLTDTGDVGRWVQSNLLSGKPGKVRLG